jgi:2-amino-4-hydroxy-6-hydroxymethyldihydropteridine diphosphokinase
VDRVIAIALGSNLGDRESHLAYARSRLAELLTGAQFSSTFETAPIGTPDVQPPYLNAAAIGRTSLDAGSLLDQLLSIEQQRGRTRDYPNAARTLDLDLILFGDDVIDGPGLIVPHPRFRERAFVLEPLAQIAPDLRDPTTGKTMAELLRQLRPAPAAHRR